MAEPQPIRLGPFELQFPLARGGQAEVWQARHAVEDLPVAIKILTREDAKQPELVQTLHAEIRAVAGLDHPHIIQLFDAGEVDEAAELASEGGLGRGAPWFAMELVSGGTLNQLQDPGWPVVREVLLDLLDALAHAHARGVVHRDLKTANILFHPDGRLVLTDFGMVFALERSDQATPVVGGTPLWMAPEQFTGRWSDQGPWTDLYGLGCIAWALVCRRPPHRGHSWTRLMTAHLEQPLPALDPAVEVPDAFEGWVQRMTSKVPSQRYRRAADAAWALAAMGRSVRQPRRLGGDGAVASGESLLPPSERTTLYLPATTPPVPVRQARPARGQVATPVRPPDMPPHWQRREPARAQGLAGTGLGLWGLRDLPMVGRRRERDQLWAALADVHGRRGAGAVLLRGPAGAGKSRLARWLSRRAHELGVATPLRATHNPGGGRLDGLAGMIARALRLDLDLDPDDLLQGLEQQVGEVARAVTELLRPPEQPVLLRTPEDRWGLLERLLPRLAEGRPAIVWVDDAQWAAEVLPMVQWFLGRPPGARVMFVITARDDILRGRPTESRLVEQLDAHSEVRTLTVGPLPEAESRALVASLIGLDGALVEQVHERAGGNPLFAVQLVGDWVARGLLEFGPGGFSLAVGARTPVPESVGAVWRGRVGRLLGQGPPEWSTALYIAAALGVDVRTEEWRGACAAAGFAAPLPLPLRLLAERLAVSEPATAGGRWSFVHGMLRETVEAMALAAGELGAAHVACASMLESRGPAQAERRARHLFAAGRAEEALAAYGVAAAWQHGRDDAAHRRILGAELEVLDSLGDDDDPRRGQVWVKLARSHHLRNESEQQEHYVRLARRFAERIGDRQILADAIHDAGTVAAVRGRSREGIDLLREALVIREEIGWERAIAFTLGELGHCELAAGFAEAAIATFERALTLADDASMTHWIGSALANALEQAGRVEDAWATLEHHRGSIQRGTPMHVAQMLHVEARILLREGRVSEAASRLRSVLALRDEVGLPAPAASLDLGLILLSWGRYDEGEAVLSKFDESLCSNDLLHGLLAARAVLAAARDDWGAFAAATRRASEVSTDWANDGLITVWRMAAASARRAGRSDDEQAAEALARIRERWCGRE